MASSTLVWLRNDLRIADNPALAAALKHDAPVHAVYVLETDRGLRPLGGAAKVWLHESLKGLNGDLAERGVRLSYREGDSATSCSIKGINKNRQSTGSRLGPVHACMSWSVQTTSK